MYFAIFLLIESNTICNGGSDRRLRVFWFKTEVSTALHRFECHIISFAENKKLLENFLSRAQNYFGRGSEKYEIWIKLMRCIHTTGWEQSNCAINAFSSVVICNCSFSREARAKSLLSNRLFSWNWFCWFSQCRNNFFRRSEWKIGDQVVCCVRMCECVSPSHRITTRPSGLFRSE